MAQPAIIPKVVDGDLFRKLAELIGSPGIAVSSELNVGGSGWSYIVDLNGLRWWVHLASGTVLASASQWRK